MSQIDRIVNVTISRETQQIDIEAFDVPLLLVAVDDTAVTVDRVSTYTTLEGVGDVFGIDSPAYKMSEKLLSNDVKVAQWKIGEVKVNSETQESYVAALAAVQAFDNDWYVLMTDTHLDTDIKAIAAAIQATRKIYVTSSSSTDILNGALTTDVASFLQTGSYNRTILLYSPTADTDFPEASWVGSQIVETPGSNTWEYKKLGGVATAKLTDNDISVLEAKDANYYITIKGAPVTRKGVSSDASWIDEIIFVDWLQARMQERVYLQLLNKKKIPYTRAGFTLIEAQMRSVLSEGVQNGGISPDIPFTVISPDPVTTALENRLSRSAKTFTFSARLADAVDNVTISGTVTA